MPGILRIFLPFNQSRVDQTIWLHNVDNKPLFIDWGDGTPLEITGEGNVQFISHTYTVEGTFTIFAYYEGVWGDDGGNAIIGTITVDNRLLLIESDEATLEDGVDVTDPLSYSENALNNAFLSLSLPNTAVEVGSNEFVVVDNINDALTKLNENNDYLLEQTTIIDPTVKNTFIGWLSGGPGTNNLWNLDQTGFDDNFATPNLSGTSFTDIVDIKVKEFTSTRYIYLIDNNRLKVLNGLSVYASTVLQASAIGFNEPFDDLMALDVDSTGSIFLLDDLKVYKANYDTISNSLVPITQIGGSGTVDDRYLFNNPGDILVDSTDRVFVVDNDNLCVKVYTNNLIWTETITSNQFGIVNKPLKITENKVTKEIYILTSNRNLYIYDANLNFVEAVNLLQAANSVTLTNILETENINKLIADNHNNYLYIVTDTATIKLTKAGRLINKIEEPTAPAFTQLRSAYIDSYDQLFVAKYDRVFWILDPTISISLKRTTSAPIALSAITMNATGHEFVQDWVYNKSLKKLLRNLVILNGSIQLKIVVSFDLDGSLRSFYVRPLESDEKVSVTITLNNFVNVNEFVLSETVNRAIRSILDYQIGVLNIIKPSVIFIPSAVEYPVLP